MPDPAPRLTQVACGDPGEAVFARFEQHAFKRNAVGSLNLSALRDRHPCLAQALCQLVPCALERPQIEHPRLGGALGGRMDAAHSVGGHERVRKLALEAGNLVAQRAARRSLVDLLGDS